ncbi:hypothetical protein PCURB6_22270 [Paenibacillus curdlanolyticus]|nr:hypothetical protein PCURB6_22270 [Paenibacillus curdlanolyticus]
MQSDSYFTERNNQSFEHLYYDGFSFSKDILHELREIKEILKHQRTAANKATGSLCNGSTSA